MFIIMPALYSSNRYPAKPRARLKGAGGLARSLLKRTVIAGQRAVELAGGNMGLFVVTDDS